MGCTHPKHFDSPLEPPVRSPKNKQLSMYELHVNSQTSDSNGEDEILIRDDNLQLLTRKLKFAAISKKGFYPQEDKPNQDSMIIHTGFSSPIAFFGVFDGHGSTGEHCSQFLKENLITDLEYHLKNTLKHQAPNYPAILNRAHEETTRKLKRLKDKSFYSGTTSISVFFHDDQIYVSNVGDSRAVLGVERDQRNKQKRSNNPTHFTFSNVPNRNQHDFLAVPLSFDQTPYRKDERSRVQSCGARVLSLQQVAGTVPLTTTHNWDRDENEESSPWGDAPRIWAPEGDYPGAAFTRSIGDFDGERFGIIAEPEIHHRTLTVRDRMIVIASDGIFEFLSNQEVISIASKHPSSPFKACRELVDTASRLWLQNDVRSDDITVIVIHLQVQSPPENITTPSPSSPPSSPRSITSQSDVSEYISTPSFPSSSDSQSSCLSLLSSSHPTDSTRDSTRKAFQKKVSERIVIEPDHSPSFLPLCVPMNFDSISDFFSPAPSPSSSSSANTNHILNSSS